MEFISGKKFFNILIIFLKKKGLPYCGWCFSKNQCTNQSNCSSFWIQENCPSIFKL